MRSVRRWLALTAMLFGAGASAQTLIVDDVESGTLLTSDAPAGRWTATYAVRAGNSLTASSAAAHRGTYGIRMVDTYSQPGSEWEGELNSALASLTGDLHVRFWLRFSNTNALGDAWVAAVTSTGASPNIAQIQVAYPGPRVVLVTRAAGGNDTFSSTSAALSEGTWHLLELSIYGVGGSAGVARLWMNGALVAERTGINWTGNTLQKLKAGEFWSDDLRFTGTIDWDDWRTSRNPHASKLSLSASGGPFDFSQCIPVDVSLRDSASGALAPASGATTVALASSVGGDAFHATASCSSTLTSVAIPNGTSTATVYFRATNAGARTLTAQNLDLLPGSTVVTTSAGTSRLAFTTPARQFSVGVCSGAANVVRVQLRDSANAPLAAGAGGQPILLSSDSPGTVDWFVDASCQTPAPGGAFTIPSGANTVDVYYRDTQPGYVRLAVVGSGLSAPPPDAHAVLGSSLEDDFESGAVLRRDTPAGKWDQRFIDDPNNSIDASALAAHRGSYGLRLVDGVSVAGSGLGTHVEQLVRSPGDQYTRYWMRVSATNPAGNLIASNTGSTASAILSMYIVADTFELGGFDATVFTTDGSIPGVTPGGWHLIEVAVTGLGTSSGQRRLWVDGQLRSTSPSLNLVGVDTLTLSLGEFWSDNRWFEGSVDFDDVRVGGTSPASHFTLTAPATGGVGDCLPLSLTLRDSALSAPAAAPYAFSAALAVTGVDASFYSDAGCTAATSLAGFAAGSSAQQVFFRARTAGAANVVARYEDFLEGTASVQFSGALPTSTDDPLGPLRAVVGCSCSGVSAAPPIVEVLLLLAVLVRSRRK